MESVLLIDPDSVARGALVSLLDADYVLHTASSLDEAVVNVRFEVLDLIFTELLDKPLEYLHHLYHAWPDIPIIVVTDNTDVTVAVEAMKFGIHDYLLKPVTASQLWTAIGRVPHPLTYRAKGGQKGSPTENLVARGFSSYLKAVRCFSDMITISEGLESLYHSITKMISRAFDCSRVLLFLRDNQSFRCVEGLSDAAVPANHPLFEYLSQERSHLHLEDLPSLNSPDGLRSLDLFEQFQLTLFVPLLDHESLVGVLGLGSKRANLPYSAMDREMLLTFASLCVPLLRLLGQQQQKDPLQEHLSSLIDEAPIAIMMVDSSQKILLATRKLESLTGQANLAGNQVHLLSQELSDQVMAAPPGTTHTTSKLQHANGNDISIEVDIHRIDPHLALVCVSTRQGFARMRNQLAADLNTWSLIASEVTHHIRNPMVPLQTFLDVYAESEMTAAPDQLYQAASEALNQLAAFADRMEPFARPYALKQQYGDLNIVLAKAIANVKRESKTAIKLNVQYTEPMPLVLAERVLLQEAFEKLIQHCLEHIPVGEPLHILTSLEEDSDDNQIIAVVLAHPYPPGDWERDRASRWDVSLAWVGKIIMEHGGAFYTCQRPPQIEHHLKFPVE